MVEVVRTEGVLGGEPRLEDRRVSVLQVVDLVLEAGHTPEYVADQFDLSLAEVHTALAYYFDNPGEMERIRSRHERLESDLRERATDPERPEP